MVGRGNWGCRGPRRCDIERVVIEGKMGLGKTVEGGKREVW